MGIRMSIFEAVWRLHHAGWPVQRINEALGISHARDVILSCWAMDDKAPSRQEMRDAVRDAMEMEVANGKHR